MRPPIRRGGGQTQSRPQAALRSRLVHRDGVQSGRRRPDASEPAMRHPDHALLRGAVAVVLGLLLALSAPAARLDGPADSTDADPVGVWPLRPGAGGGRRVRPAGLPCGAGSPRRGPRRRAGAAGARRTAGHGDLRRAARRPRRRGGGPRRDPDDLRAGRSRGLDRRRAGQPETGSGPSQVAGSHCFPRACLHWGWIRGETYLDPLRLVGVGPGAAAAPVAGGPGRGPVHGERAPPDAGCDQARGCACW